MASKGWITLFAGAAISALAVTRAFIQLSQLGINEIARKLFEKYDTFLRETTFWISDLIYNVGYLFNFHISLPAGWHTIFAVMMLKPLADAAVDGRPDNPRWLTRAYFIITGFVFAIACSIGGSTTNPDDMRPIIAVVLGLSFYEFFKNLVIGSLYITEANHAKYGLGARKQNILYYLRWYAGGFSLIGLVAVGSAWLWKNTGLPSPSAFGSVVYLSLLALYHLMLAVQAYRNNKIDFKNGFMAKPGPPFSELVRTKWFVRLTITLSLSLVAVLAAIAHA